MIDVRAIKVMLKVVVAIFSLIAFVGTAYADGDVKKGKKVFKKCKICHEIGDGAKHKTGPQLNDLIDRKAGSLEDYPNYSQVMKEAGEKGLVWSDDKLDEFLIKPKKFLPGIKMTFVGLKKSSQRANVIAYLKTFTK